MAPYLTGEWSEVLDYPAMPFDAVMLGSRMMVAKESKLSPSAKALVVDTPGVDNERYWEACYTGAAGGIVTVTSELGRRTTSWNFEPVFLSPLTVFVHLV